MLDYIFSSFVIARGNIWSNFLFVSRNRLKGRNIPPQFAPAQFACMLLVIHLTWIFVHSSFRREFGMAERTNPKEITPVWICVYKSLLYKFAVSPIHFSVVFVPVTIHVFYNRNTRFTIELSVYNHELARIVDRSWALWHAVAFSAESRFRHDGDNIPLV